MIVDDEREYPARPWPWGRLAWAAAAVVLLTFACGGMLSAEPAGGGVDLPPDRLAMTAGLITVLLLIGWLVSWLAVVYVRLLRVVFAGEVVRATVTERESRIDAEGDRTWQVRVTGLTSSGAAFNRGLSFGYHEPGPVGSVVEVRYHAGLRRIWQLDRGFAAFAMVVFGHLTALWGFVVLAVLAYFSVLGIGQVWT